MRRETFECECLSHKHLVKFVLDDEDNFLSVIVNLNNWLPWYKRILVGIKYILGLPTNYHEFDEVILQQKDIQRLQEILTETLEPTKLKTHWLEVKTELNSVQLQSLLNKNNISLESINTMSNKEV